MSNVKINKKQKGTVTIGGIPDWVLNIENDPHAIEKAKIAQKQLDAFGLPKDIGKDLEKH